MFRTKPGCSGQPTLSVSRRTMGWIPISAALASLTLAGSLLLGSNTPARANALTAKSDLFVAKKVASHPTSGWSSVIVKLPGELTPEHRDQIRSLGGYVYRHLPIIRSAAVRVPNKNVSRLAVLPFVMRLSSDVQVKKTDDFTVEGSGADVAFQQYELTGQGVTVAVLDSGVRGNGKDLADPGTRNSRVLCNIGFTSGDPGANDACGHGTHVAGIIAGNGTASTGSDYFRTFYGIARRANLVNVRVLDGQGQGNVSDVIKGIEWCIKKKNTYKIRVMNLSLGHPVGESYTTDPLCQAVEKAWKAGIVVVCAAGNSGRLQNEKAPFVDNEGYGRAYGSIQVPGNSPYVITVGAMKSANGKPGKYNVQDRPHDRIATYSSRGPSRLDFVMKPDLVAPGNRVVSLGANLSYLDTTYSASNGVALQEYCSTRSTTDTRVYFRLSGTSMAAPAVSGAAALMLQADSTLSPDTVKARLMLSADKWGLPNGDMDPCTFGAGYLNVPAALNSTAVATQYALSPSLSQDDQGNVYINMDAIWGDRAIWGTGVGDLRAVWGTRAIWGTNVLEASRAIWGTTVWADRALWGTSSSTVDLTSTALQGEN